MAITTWLSAAEVNNYKSVTSKELNEIFQEIRTLDDRYYLKEDIIETKRFLRATKRQMMYTMFIWLQSEEFQIMNFCRDTKWSINTMVPASYIYAYFYGFLGGIKSQIKETKQLIT